MNKLFIGFDLDDVILNKVKIIGDLARGITCWFPTNWLYEHTIDQLIDRRIITREQYDEIKSIMYNDLFKGILHLEPYKDGLEILEKLRKDGHACLAVTNRFDLALLMADHIRRSYFPWLEIVSVRSKDKTWGTLGMDVFVDDDPEKLRYLTHVPYRILFSYGYHTDADKRCFIETKNWRDIYREINKIAHL